jgi:hypothetical protein
VPKITDFGLAKQFQDQPGETGPAQQTASGAILGTPSYMAPEQAGGQAKAVGPACDVYALLLRRGGQEGRLKAVALEPLVEGLPHAVPKRLGWYVNGQGQTFTIIPAGQEFTMGSPEDEPGRFRDEVRHRVRIGRAFALATKAVTVEQYCRFIDARGLRRWFESGGVAEVLKRYSPDPDGPMVVVDWYQAAQYCNWLSEQEGIPEEKWVYPTERQRGMPTTLAGASG